MNHSHKLLAKAGRVLLGLLISLVLLVMVLHGLQIINAWQLPLKPVLAFLGGGSLSCWIAAQIMKGWHQSPRAAPRTLRWRRRVLFISLFLLISLNASTYLAAYTLTHVRDPGQWGLGFPKPTNIRTPQERGLSYSTHRLPINSSAWLEAWLIPATGTPAQGTVVMFPGNRSTKDRQLIGPAQTFSQLGYNSLLVDYRGVGGSSGYSTTVGMREAEDVVVAFNALPALDLQPPVIAYGVSMGSAAILNAIATQNLQPDAIIIELPFARFIDAVRSRLQHHQIPPFPLAELLVFWGGVQHGVNGFSHNPVEFARAIQCPTLVMQGQQDPWTTVAEVKTLFQQITAPKQLVIAPDGGHHQLIGIDRALWETSLSHFLQSINADRES
ncbi:alpha/beta hydrolase [Acaryochloris sp. CCMEE 5410]|uniref:alpha/beta hydrolase n=1 Tax=Acaryochloris sp. CCMEE 5410 TaxID=310037 RepID=UPI0002483F55|nr:alpha/beta fold hydrolase [Acaryochloris sp. CCMEE 5410]KAI9131444.1 alpha/beta hydrolase [Acaryochloris sp. CCMEE 5410]